MIPRPRIGIDVDRCIALTKTNPAAARWFDGLYPILRRCSEIVALNEGLTHWRATRHVHPHWVIGNGEELATYTINIVTPPARPEWLTTIGD